jgi:hypothetical protein
MILFLVFFVCLFLFGPSYTSKARKGAGRHAMCAVPWMGLHVSFKLLPSPTASVRWVPGLWTSADHQAQSASCTNCLRRGLLYFPVWLSFTQPPGIFFFPPFFFKQTRRLKQSCHPRRRHAFSNPPVWERSQLDEQRKGPHVWDE